MTWLRLDDSFTMHPKVAQLSDHNFRVWVRVLCHCSRFQDPTVDDSTIREVQGLTRQRIASFADAGLLDSCGKEHEVHDWAKYQPADKTGAERQAKWRARRNGHVTGKVTSLSRARATDPSRPLQEKDLDLGSSSKRGAHIWQDADQPPDLTTMINTTLKEMPE